MDGCRGSNVPTELGPGPRPREQPKDDTGARWPLTDDEAKRRVILATEILSEETS